MLIFAGIDEAGYGPMLGPLCVGCTVFVIPEADPSDGPPNLWSMLRSAVCRRPSDKKRRVAVDDSKRLKGPRDGSHHPLRHLERGVLSFCPMEDDELPHDDARLLERLGVAVPEHPWLDSMTALPLGQTGGELRIARARVQRALDRSGSRCELIACRAIDAEQFNLNVEATGSKAAVNFAAAASLLDQVWRRWPEHPRVVLDRHGGRTRYGAELVRHLPGSTVEVVAETPTLSRYRLLRDDAALTVTFAQDGDERFFPVCLASMVAKYVRELFMLRLNRYFQARVPELRPTAGYVQDARRYLDDIDVVIRQLDLPRPTLVRMT